MGGINYQTDYPELNILYIMFAVKHEQNGNQCICITVHVFGLFGHA